MCCRKVPKSKSLSTVTLVLTFVWDTLASSSKLRPPGSMPTTVQTSVPCRMASWLPGLPCECSTFTKLAGPQKLAFR